ncbi:MAG: ribokinase [Clostridia bacterium]|nr:ribokinase [Clostridia bacterium]
MKIFVVGSLNMDLVVKAPFMPENGMTITGEGFMTNPGGKGANQAVALAKLGADAYMVGCVGDAFGNELKNTLCGYGVNTDFVEKVNGVSSGIAVIVVVDGDNRIILDAGSNAKITTELVDKALSVAEKGDYLVTQLEVSQDIVAYSLKKAKEKGMITVLNPAPAAKLKDGILEYCDFFIPNQSETKFYTGVYPEDEVSARKCAEILAEKGVKNLLITMGEKGSAGIIDGKFRSAKCYKTNAIDTTAAGDTYVGGFVARLSAGDVPEAAMDFASRASSITCSRRGAQQSIPVKAEVDAKKA